MTRELRKVFFTVPEIDIPTGGYSAEVDAMNLVKEFCEANLITFDKRCPGYYHLDDTLNDHKCDDAIFVVHWGPDVPGLIKRLQGRNVIYHAHSTGYGFTVPVDVPIVTVSKHSMSYWGAQAACSPIFYVPNVIPDRYSNKHCVRDLDVLVQERKSSKYLMSYLVPALKEKVKVTVIKDWVKDITEYFNRTKVYLYDSCDYWHNRGVSEGFGLPPLEAIACGCTVFSSVNHGLSDFLRPGFNAHKIRCTSIEYDLSRICLAVQEWQDRDEEPSFMREYRRPEVRAAWISVMTELNRYFDARINFGSLIDPADRLKKPSRSIYLIGRVTNRLLSIGINKRN